MKKLALLLAALGVVSAAAYAAPELTVTNFGQSIESENVSGTNDIDDLWLWNTVGLKYDDWSFGLTAGKQWAVDFDDHTGYEKGVKSDDSRIQFDVAKPVTENLKLTGRYRGQKTYDRFQVGYSYVNGMFLSSGDFFYDSKNGDARDAFHAEWHPIGVKLGAVQVKYYFEYVKNMGDVRVGENEETFEHQIRLYAPLYTGERLSLSTEGRFTIMQDKEFNGKKEGGYNVYDDFGRTRLYLKSNYAMTENLDVFGTFGYEMREYKGKDGANNSNDEYWSNVVIGYNYKF